VDPSRVTEALQAIREMTKLSESDPGVLYFCFAQDDLEPSILHAHERYTGREPFDEHRKLDAVQEFLSSGIILSAETKCLIQIQ
jgi:quinol monooxygenase YgiN